MSEHQRPITQILALRGPQPGHRPAVFPAVIGGVLGLASSSRSVRTSVRPARAPSPKPGRQPTSPESMLSPILPRPETLDRQPGNVPGTRLWMLDGVGDSLDLQRQRTVSFMLSDSQLTTRGAKTRTKHSSCSIHSTIRHEDCGTPLCRLGPLAYSPPSENVCFALSKLQSICATVCLILAPFIHQNRQRG